MTYRKNDPFGLGNPAWYAANYQNWTPVTLPDGRVVYEVPGFPGYTYDPVKSRATGNASFTVNPQSQITAAKTQDDQAKAEEDLKLKTAQAQLDSQDPVHQLTPAVTGTAGTVGSLYAANKLGLIGPQGTTAAKVAQQVTSPAQQAAQGAQQATNGTTQTVGNVANTGSNAGASTASVVGQNADGTFAMSDGSTATAIGQNIDGTPIFADGADAAADGATSASGAAAQGFMTTPIESLGGVTASGILGGAAALHGGYELYNGLGHGAGVGQSAMSGAEMGAGIGTMFMPGLGTAIGAGGGAIIGALGGEFLSHKGTKQVQNEAIGALSSQSNDAGYQNDLAEAANASRLGTYLTDKNGVTHDKWEDTMASGADPNQLVNALGNLQTYGAKWSSLTPQQKLAVTQANINSGIYDPNLGVVGITDKDTAQSNLDKVLGGGITPATTTTPGQAAANGALGDNQRTITRSPGILANGHHIVYGQ